MICLSMIVKNESRIIERCLNSLKGVIDSWCIVDTGSTDGTQRIIKEVLKDIPGKLVERPWVNFGHNRTEAFQYSKGMGTWALLLDADMVLENIGFKKGQLDSRVDAYSLIQKNRELKYRNIRLINLAKEWKCVGVTHEYWDLEEGSTIKKDLDTLEIKDLGDGGEKSNKFTRDIALLIDGIQKEPQNIRYKFYLAQSYKDIGDFETAIPWYEYCAANSQWPEERWYSEYMKLKCMIQLKRPTIEIEQQLGRAWMSRPWRAEALVEISNYYRELKDWQKVYRVLKAAESIEYPKDDVLFIEYQIYGGLILDELAVAAYWSGKIKESIEIIDRLLKTEYGSREIKRLKINREHSVRALKR